MPKLPNRILGSNKMQLPTGMRKGLDRIHTGPEELGSWLVKFSKLNLNALTDKQDKELTEEVWAFTTLGMMAFNQLKTLANIKELARAETVWNDPNTTYPRQIIERWQEITRKSIRSFIDESGAVFPVVAIQPVLINLGQSVRIVFNPAPESLDGPFVMGLIDVLRQMGAKLARCPAPDCKTDIFVTRRYGQIYCSSTCRLRVTMRKIRQQEREAKLKTKVNRKRRPSHGTKTRKR